jgi:hypothetical protein
LTLSPVERLQGDEQRQQLQGEGAHADQGQQAEAAQGMGFGEARVLNGEALQQSPAGVTALTGRRQQQTMARINQVLIELAD